MQTQKLDHVGRWLEDLGFHPEPSIYCIGESVYLGFEFGSWVLLLGAPPASYARSSQTIYRIDDTAYEVAMVSSALPEWPMLRKALPADQDRQTLDCFMLNTCDDPDTTFPVKVTKIAL